MATSTSSSYGEAKTRMRIDEAKRRRCVGRRSRSLDGSSCKSSEDERNENISRNHRRNGGKEYARPSRRKRRSSSCHDRSRRRKRSPSPSPPRRKKIRCKSDSDSPHSRSRSSHYHSHNQCKYSSFHERTWHRSGGSRYDDCCCVSYYYSERENRTCSIRKERRSRSPLRCEGGEHDRSRTSESISYGSNSKTLQTSEVRRQTSCDVNYENVYLQTESDIPQKGSYSGSSAQIGKATQEEFRSNHGSKVPSTEKGRHSPPSLQQGDDHLKEKLRSTGGCTDELLDRLGDWSGPGVRRKYGADQLVKPGTLGTVVEDPSDWLDLSLKAPAKPTPKFEGLSREDLRLCLDSSMPPAPEVDKTRAKHAKQKDEKAPSTSSCKEVSEASFCSTSFLCVQAVDPIFKASLSGRRQLLDVDCPGNTTMQEETTFSLNNAKVSPSLNLDRDAETTGSPLPRGQKTKDEKCFYIVKQLISSSEDKDETVAELETDLPVAGSLKDQPASLAVSSKQEPHTGNVITSPTRADMSVSVIELSNSLSTQENGVGRAELSDGIMEVNSLDCFMSVKEKVEVCTIQDTSAMPVDPCTLSQTRSSVKSLKTSLPVAVPCLVVELSDSTTTPEDADEQASEVQSQPALPSTISPVNETSARSELIRTLDVKDQPPVKSSCLQNSSIDRNFSAVNSDCAVGRTGKDSVQDRSDLDHATDLFIEKVQSLLNHARPRSPSVASKPNISSSLTENWAEQPGSKHKIRREDPPSSRRGCVEVVELSDSSSASVSFSDESDGNQLASSTERCNNIYERKFKPVEPLKKKTLDSAEMMNDHPLQYLNEDVVCCSSKPPLKRGRDSGSVQQSRVTYMRDKRGNLIQVVDVDDSDAEDEAEEPDTKSCEDDKEDEFFSQPQVLPLIEEIKEMLQGASFSVPKSHELDDQYKPRSPDLKAKPSARTQISSRPVSQKGKSCRVISEDSDSQGSGNGTGAAVDSTSLTSTIGLKQREKWKRGIFCDLCSLGPSLALGEWYCWCCGIPATKCECSEEKKLRKQLSLGFRKGQVLKKKGKKIIRYQWSGKVHRMCALWSSEVYVKQSPKKEPYFAQLGTAVKRGKTLFCRHPDCKKTGATLGCRVRACRRSYHYPCAEKLANQCMVRMWDGVLIPIACQYHRHVEEQAERARERSLRTKITDPVRDGKTVVPAERPFIGKNLLCKDIAQGQEQVQIPCTNDVDHEPAPSIRYITKCWFKGRPVDHLHPVGTELAKGCQGCAGSNFDNPHTPMALHVMGAGRTNRSRGSDDRLDWQGERMDGRLPYNSAGLLQLGPDSKDIIECNSRCKCGPKCKNRELQKGLRCHLELFKTKDRGWGVRALEQIPRGKFVVEYVGDVLTQAEADERGEKYDQNQLSYLFNLDHPGVSHNDAIVLDGITMSNIARFINHSCEGNLMIFRVFSETTDLRYFRIGMYAIQDIEVGDELSYDYNYASSKDSSEMVDDPTAIRCFCGAQTCRKWLWQGGDTRTQTLSTPHVFSSSPKHI